MRQPFSIKLIYLIEKRSFDQKYKFSNKNDMVSAWRNFKNIFSRPLFTIIFRPEMLKFHPYSILTGDTMVRFVIFCVIIDVPEMFRPANKIATKITDLAARSCAQPKIQFNDFRLRQFQNLFFISITVYLRKVMRILQVKTVTSKSAHNHNGPG